MFSEFIENLIYSLDIERPLEESIAGAIPIYTFDILLSFDPLLKEYYNEAIRNNSDLKEMRIEGIINIGSEYFYREVFSNLFYIFCADIYFYIFSVHYIVIY